MTKVHETIDDYDDDFWIAIVALEINEKFRETVFWRNFPLFLVFPLWRCDFTEIHPSMAVTIYKWKIYLW